MLHDRVLYETIRSFLSSSLKELGGSNSGVLQYTAVVLYLDAFGPLIIHIRDKNLYQYLNNLCLILLRKEVNMLLIKGCEDFVELCRNRDPKYPLHGFPDK